MNYGQIKNLAKFYIHRTDLDAYWDTFFGQARELISTSARLLVMEKREIVTPIDQVYTLPIDFLEMRSVLAPSSRGMAPLQYLDRASFENYGRGTTSGYQYTIQGRDLMVRRGGDIEISYFARPPELVDDSDTNDVLTNFPNLYLFSALIYGNLALQDIETQQIASEQFKAELSLANDSDEKARRSGDAPQMQAR